MGYDIADYKAIDKVYGSIDDVDQLIVELKSRDMELMMDLVVNHTSDEVYIPPCILDSVVAQYHLSSPPTLSETALFNYFMLFSVLRMLVA